MKKLLIISAICLILSGCESTGEEINAVIEVCATNGGVNTYKVNHSVMCNNGMFSRSPVETAKNMKEIKH